MRRFPRLRDLDESLTMQFVVPVILENSLTIFISMAVSQVVSTISASALAAIGMANSVMNVVSALFSMVTTGTSVLVSRQIGAGENEDVADSIEQSTFLTLITTMVLTLLGMLLASPLLHLLMPSAEAGMFMEAVRYFRILMISLPFLILHSVFSGVCRGLGNSRTPMITAIVMNLSQLLFAWLCIRILGWNELGAGAAIVICRVVGAGLLFVTLLKDQRRFTLRLRNMLRPHAATCRRILRIGLPMSLESLFVQLGYMLGNTMAIALGSFASGVSQIIGTVNTFTGLPQGICAAVAMSSVGHLLGKKDYKGAKIAGWTIWALGIVTSAALGLIAYTFGESICGIYSSDPATIKESARLLWILLFMNATGVSINAIDPQLRVGGDVTYVMTTTLIAVWLIRLPLTWLLCFYWDFGVLGIYLGNTIALAFRMTTGLIRYCSNKWMYKRV